ncbi:MAG: hypothetical protein WCK84_01495 [Bacteroidota bacterium]
MKKQLIFTLFLFMFLLSILSCKKEKEITCNLSTTINQPSVGMSIKYEATQTGDGVIASLSYVSESGTVTVPNPGLPWTITVYVASGTNVSISANGTVTNGSLNIAYEGISGGSSIKSSDFCEQQTSK